MSPFLSFWAARPACELRCDHHSDLHSNVVYHHHNGGNTNTKTLNGEIKIGGKSDGYRHFQSHIVVFTDFCVQLLGNVVHATESEDRTPCRTHIFLSVARFDHHTHLRVAQGLDGSMFHRPLFDVLDPFLSFDSTPPPSTPTAMPMTGIRRSPSATPHEGSQFGHLDEPTPLTQ